MEKVEALIRSVLTGADVLVQEEGEVFLAGGIPDTQPKQYLYELFKPLSEEEIQQLADGFRMPFPRPLADFYRLTNGGFFFGRHICIFGMPLWSAQYKQPMALSLEDAKRPPLCPRDRLFFAAYSAESQIRLFFSTRETGVMHVYAAGSNGKVLAQWPSFEDWLISEHDRYLAKYRSGEYRMADIAGVLKEIEFDVEF